MVWYEFDSFQFDDQARILLRGGQPVTLTPKAADLLLLFLKKPGVVIPHEELISQLWPDTTVEDGNLSYQVHGIRAALGCREDGGSYVKNLPKRGYQFVARVRMRYTEPTAVPPSPPPGQESIRDETQPRAVPNVTTDRPSKVHRLAPRSMGYTIFGVLLSLALTAVLASRFAPPPQLRVARYTQLTTDGRDKGALFTDGVRVYFEERTPDGNALSAVAVAGGGTAIVPLSLSHIRIFDFFSSGSEILAGKFVSEEEGFDLWVVPLLGGSPRRVAELRATSATWSPDRQQIAFTMQGKLYVANSDGTARREIAETGGDVSWLRWSPDGKILRFTEGTYKNGDAWEAIWEIGVDGSHLRRLLDGWNTPAQECCGGWTPDGRFFIFQATRKGRPDLWALSERRDSFGNGSASPVLLSSISLGIQGYASPAISPDGNHLFAVGLQERGELVRYDSGLREFVPFLGGISATWVTFSRSGRSIAYIDYKDLTVWRANADGSNKIQITFSPLQADGLCWSPDEKWLAVRARVPGKPWMIYVVPAQGGDVRLLIPGEAEQGVPTWSADGRNIAFGDVPPAFGKSSGAELIHILDLSTHKLSDLPGSQKLWTARWSPDGSSLAALTIEGQRLLVYDFTAKKWRSTKAENVNNPTWSRDSRYIYFDTEGSDRVLNRVQIADGHVEQLVSLRDYPRLAWSWSGVAPDNSPIILRNLGSTEIYSLTLELR